MLRQTADERAASIEAFRIVRMLLQIAIGHRRFRRLGSRRDRRLSGRRGRRFHGRRRRRLCGRRRRRLCGWRRHRDAFTSEHHIDLARIQCAAAKLHEIPEPLLVLLRAGNRQLGALLFYGDRAALFGGAVVQRHTIHRGIADARAQLIRIRDMLHPLSRHREQLRVDVALLRAILHAQPQAVVADIQHDHLRILPVKPPNAGSVFARLRAHQHGVPRRIGNQALERVFRRLCGHLRPGRGRRLRGNRFLRIRRRFRAILRLRCCLERQFAVFGFLPFNLLEPEQLAEDEALGSARLHGDPELSVALRGAKHLYAAAPRRNLPNGLRLLAWAAAHVDRTRRRVTDQRSVCGRIAQFCLRGHRLNDRQCG